MILRNYIRFYRRLRGLTQSELASLVGVSKNTISSIETHQLGCSAYLAARFCQAFDLQFTDLFDMPDNSLASPTTYVVVDYSDRVVTYLNVFPGDSSFSAYRRYRELYPSAPLFFDVQFYRKE